MSNTQDLEARKAEIERILQEKYEQGIITKEVRDGGWAPSHPIPENPLEWGEKFPKAAITTIKNTQMRENLGRATTTIRNKRNIRAAELPDWQDLRESGAAMKRYVGDNLPELLIQMEKNVEARGGVVHWARDAAEANKIAAQIFKERGIDEIVKVKSMLTQEIGLNEYLEAQGIKAYETDLAELIVQLSKDMPSHIVVPAIHRNRTEVRNLFMKTIPSAPEVLSDEPEELTQVARGHLREKFVNFKGAVSGANMMIADSGSLVIFESEGNGRMCTTVPDVLVSLVGIEKIVPTMQDIEIVGQQLGRSATGERMNPYTSVWSGVNEDDGPKEFHLILLDNGRSKVLSDTIGRQALHCIRCAACMNACPVYRVVGGHAYGSVYPGPIGSVLSPQLVGDYSYKRPVTSLPYACSLCQACYEACPMQINLPECLVHLRHKITEENRDHTDGYSIGMKLSSGFMSSGKKLGWYSSKGKFGRILARDGAIKKLPFNMFSGWTNCRDIPAPPQKNFRAWYKEHKKEGDR